jgi:beta-alanine degradation protein BauB
MLPQPKILLLMGTDYPSLAILFLVFAIPGFFIWRWLLRFLINKGPKGINIAAVIMGGIQSPILMLILGAVIYWIMISREEAALRDAKVSELTEQYDSEEYAKLDTTSVDVISASPDKAKVILENDYVRVLEYTLAPGEKDNPHTHPPKTYYVVGGGTLRVYPEGGEPFDAEEKKGTAEWGDRVGMHYVENVGKTTVKLVVTEVKGAEYY